MKYFEMNETQRRAYIDAQVQDCPDEEVSKSAKSYNYLVPLSAENGKPSTEGPNPGQAISWTNRAPAPGVQNFSFFDVMEVRCVGYRGKLSMVSQRFQTSMLLSTTCDHKVLERIHGGFVEGIWQFKKQGDAYILIVKEIF